MANEKAKGFEYKEGIPYKELDPVEIVTATVLESLPKEPRGTKSAFGGSIETCFWELSEDFRKY